MNEKKCPHCKETKLVSEYYKGARGYSGWCKNCLKEDARQRVADGRNRESQIRSEVKKGHFRKSNEKRVKFTKLDHMVSEIYCNVKKRASRRMPDQPFEVTREWLLKKITEFCSLNYYELGTRSPFKPSVDRIDNSKGYIESNVRIVWLIENVCRNIYTDEQVIEFCKRKLGLLQIQSEGELHEASIAGCVE